MYTIKERPEDFVVKENPGLFGNGVAIICILRKKNYTTRLAVDIVAKNLGTSKIGFAGNKDKQAVTEQYISIEGISEDKISKFSHPDISLEIVGKGNPISLGNLKGNTFLIRLRNVIGTIYSKEYFVNYFGEQRFSVANVDVGRALVKKDFKKAVALIAHNNHKQTELEVRLKKNPSDYIGALTSISPSTLSLYINAYQSYLWNLCVSNIIKSSSKSSSFISISNMSFFISDYCSALDVSIPMVGFETENIPLEMQNILHSEGITPRDFIFPQYKQLTAPGGSRRIFAKADDVLITPFKEDLIYDLQFSLPKGSYATVYIAQLFRA